MGNNSNNEKFNISSYAIFFCLATTLHNLEEAIWLPEWSQSAYSIQQPVAANEFHFAVIIITALAYLIAFFFVQFYKIKMVKYAFIGFLGAMIFNAFFPHLISTIVMNAYAPGLVTGFLLNIPINTYILYQLYQQRFINLKSMIISTVIVGSVLLMLIPILFYVGGILINW